MKEISRSTDMSIPHTCKAFFSTSNGLSLCVCTSVCLCLFVCVFVCVCVCSLVSLCTNISGNFEFSPKLWLLYLVIEVVEFSSLAHDIYLHLTGDNSLTNWDSTVGTSTNMDGAYLERKKKYQA